VTAAPRPPVRRRASCARGRGARSKPCGRRPSPCGRETRDGACARACWVDRSASPLNLRIRSRVKNRGHGLDLNTQSQLPPQLLDGRGPSRRKSTQAPTRRFWPQLMPRGPAQVNSYSRFREQPRGARAVGQAERRLRPGAPEPTRRQPQTDMAPTPSGNGAKPKSMPAFSKSRPLAFLAFSRSWPRLQEPSGVDPLPSPADFHIYST
jgi:hypothetical protein